MDYVLIGECGKHSHVMQKINDEQLCPGCMKKKGIDNQWVKDYKEALKDLSFD